MRRIVPDPYGLLKGEGVNALRAVCTRPRQTVGIVRANSRRGNGGQRGTHSDGVLRDRQAYTRRNHMLQDSKEEVCSKDSDSRRLNLMWEGREGAMSMDVRPNSKVGSQVAVGE